MSSFHCCVSRTPITANQRRACKRIAREHGFTFEEVNTPSYQRWFTGPNLGDPFDRDNARTIHAALTDAGITV